MITFNKLRKNTYLNLKDVRVRTYTVMGFTLFTVIILTTFAIRPVIFKLSDEIGTYNSFKAADDKLKSTLTTLAADQAIYNQSVKGSTDTLNSAIPDAPETGPLFANIEAIANADKVVISTIKFIKDNSNNDIQSINLGSRTIVSPPHTAPLYFSMSGTGKYADFNSFINDLENYPRIINIIDVNYSTALGDNSQAGVSSIGITGYVFYLVK